MWCGVRPPPRLAATTDLGLQDSALYNAVKSHGTKWTLVSVVMTNRTPRQCADRWRRYGELLELERAGDVLRDKNKRAGGLPVKSTLTFLDPKFDDTVKNAVKDQLSKFTE